MAFVTLVPRNKGDGHDSEVNVPYLTMFPRIAFILREFMVT